MKSQTFPLSIYRPETARYHPEMEFASRIERVTAMKFIQTGDRLKLLFGKDLMNEQNIVALFGSNQKNGYDFGC